MNGWKRSRRARSVGCIVCGGELDGKVRVSGKMAATLVA